MNSMYVLLKTRKYIADQALQAMWKCNMYMGGSQMGNQTQGTQKYKQAMAVSYSIKDRAHWPAKVKGVEFLCDVLKKMLRDGQPQAFQKGRK